MLTQLMMATSCALFRADQCVGNFVFSFTSLHQLSVQEWLYRIFPSNHCKYGSASTKLSLQGKWPGTKQGRKGHLAIITCICLPLFWWLGKSWHNPHQTHMNLSLSLHCPHQTHVYYIYICVCVCTCRHLLIYVYIYMCVCVKPIYFIYNWGMI